MSARKGPEVEVVGRYALHGEIASGGMATVRFARLLGPVGFSRTVAVKRLHPPFAKDPEFVSMFLDEARLAGRIQHPNVVPTLDVVATDDELFIVMEYIHGDPLSRLLAAARAREELVPVQLAATIVAGVLHGLHAAHDARDEHDVPLEIVHRDVTPQNVLVGVDGTPRVLDFGIARAAGRLHTTRDGQIKGKIAYLAPEQLLGRKGDRRVDVYATGAVLWEVLTGSRLFQGENEGEILHRILEDRVPPPSELNRFVSPALDAIVLRALDRDPDRRFGTAREMALALERDVGIVAASVVAEWVERLAGDVLSARQRCLVDIESSVEGGTRKVQARPAGQDEPSEPSIDVELESGSTGPISVTLDEPKGGGRRRRRRRAGLAAAIAAAIAASTAVLLLRSKPSTPEVWSTAEEPAAKPTGEAAAGNAAVPPAALAPAPSAGSAPVRTGAAAPASSSVAPAQEFVTAKRAVPPAAPSHRRSAPRAASSGAAQTAPAAPSASAPRTNCNPPYMFDSMGIKHIKLECI